VTRNGRLARVQIMSGRWGAFVFPTDLYYPFDGFSWRFRALHGRKERKLHDGKVNMWKARSRLGRHGQRQRRFTNMQFLEQGTPRKVDHPPAGLDFTGSGPAVMQQGSGLAFIREGGQICRVWFRIFFARARKLDHIIVSEPKGGRMFML
jgi:hypothetical protein